MGAYLYFTVLPHCPLVLGMPFLQKFNPDIDWCNLKLSFGLGGTSCPPVYDPLLSNQYFLLDEGQTAVLSSKPSSVSPVHMCVHAGARVLAGDHVGRR